VSRFQRQLLLLALLVGALGVLVWRWSASNALREAVDRALTHVERREPELALRAIRPHLDAGRRDGELWFAAARAYRLLDDPGKAIQCLESAAEYGFVSAEADLERGLALAAVGRLREAEALLEFSPTKDAAASLASIHLQLFELEKALNNLSTWKRLDPDDPAPYVVAGSVWAQAMEHEKAVEQFRGALELRPDLFEARILLAISLVELGEIDEAAELLRACLEQRPQNAEAMWRLAQCEVERGEVAVARELLEKLTTDHPHLAAALVDLAKIELDDGNIERAERLLSDAVTQAPNDDAAQYNLSLALERLGRSDEAAEHMARARELQDLRNRLKDAMDRVNADPADLDAQCDAAEICLELDDRQQAASLFGAVLARDPQHARAREGAKKLTKYRAALKGV
jgi:tetratricopeptide (TPR) repeat protein